MDARRASARCRTDLPNGKSFKALNVALNFKRLDKIVVAHLERLAVQLQVHNVRQMPQTGADIARQVGKGR